MERAVKPTRNKRRTNVQLDIDVMRELEKLVREYGFGNVNITTLMKNAGLEPNVFYRRYGSIENLYGILAKEYDFWIHNTIELPSLNTLGDKKFFSETLKKLYKDLSNNDIMQKLLQWELTTDNQTTRRAAQIRDTMNLNLITYYEKLFEPLKINIKGIAALFIGGLYYLVLHRERAEICTIDFNTAAGEHSFHETIDNLTDMLFEKLEAYNEKKDIAVRMANEGISESLMCKLLNISKNELKKMLL